VNLQAPLSANPAPQKPLSQTVDMHQHALVGLFHLGHGMSFQTQLFSDKGLYEHFGPGPFVFLGRKNEINPTPGCSSNPGLTQPQTFKGLQPQLHFSDKNPFFVHNPPEQRRHLWSPHCLLGFTTWVRTGDVLLLSIELPPY
jgi:hypothetical protein